MRTRLIYVAGPYTHPDPVVNVREACLAGARLLDLDFAAIVPHTSMLWDAITPRPYEVWLDNDMEPLRRSDAVLRLPGDSTGADGEVLEAKRLGIPVFYSIEALVEYFAELDEVAGRVVESAQAAVRRRIAEVSETP